MILLLQVESIMLSIISMLSSPNDESPANVEAAVSNKFGLFNSLYLPVGVPYFLVFACLLLDIYGR